MNKIFQGLSGEILNLVEFLDHANQEVLKETVKSKDEDYSFFIKFGSALGHNEEKIKKFYEINKKYGYKFQNNFNKKLNNVNDLVRILMSSNYNQEFLIDCLKELTEEELKKTCIESNILEVCFKQNKTKLLKFIEKEEYLWNEKSIKIVSQYLNNLELSEVFYRNTNKKEEKEDLSGYRKQCKEFLTNKIKYVEKNQVDYLSNEIVKFFTDMLKKEEIFTQEFKEELVGISLASPQSKIINVMIKLLFDEKISTYKPQKPIWLYFDNLNNKDILYSFIENFKHTDYWEDSEGKKHFKIDYLNKALYSMQVNLFEKSYRSAKEKRDYNISENIKEEITKYINAIIDESNGQIGFVREILNERSKIKSNMKITIDDDVGRQRELLDKTIFYKKDNEYVILDEIKSNIRNIKGLEKTFKIMKDVEIGAILERFYLLSLDEEVLNTLIEEYKERKLIIDISNLDEKNVWGSNKRILEDLKKINHYHELEAKLSIDSNKKEKKVKI